jgi:hypothetical protein
LLGRKRQTGRILICHRRNVIFWIWVVDRLVAVFVGTRRRCWWFRGIRIRWRRAVTLRFGQRIGDVAFRWKGRMCVW